jgi:hypothetical protein
MSSADVSGIQPVNFQTSSGGVFPTEEVGVSHSPSVPVGGVTDPCEGEVRERGLDFGRLNKAPLK